MRISSAVSLAARKRKREIRKDLSTMLSMKEALTVGGKLNFV